MVKHGRHGGIATKQSKGNNMKISILNNEYYTLMQPVRAEQLARCLTLSETDGTVYEARHCPNEHGKSFIVATHDGEEVGRI